MGKASPEAVSALLDAGGDIHARDTRGRTALHLAAFARNWAVAALLLGHGADPLAEDDDGNTPRCAIRTFLAAGGHPPPEPVNARPDFPGWRKNPEYDPEAVRKILLRYVSDEEADRLLRNARAPESDHWPSRTADARWFAAAAPGNVALLLEAGADVRARGERGETPLHHATASGNGAVAILLLDRGADPNDADADGTTALHLAAGNNDLEIARILLDRGAEVNVQEEDSWTPLHHGAVHGVDSPLVSLLLERGADAAIPNAVGQIAADLADEPGVLDDALDHRLGEDETGA